MWAAVAVLLVGLIVSAAAGLMRRASVSKDGRQSFQLTASSVTTTLSTLLGRDADFVGTLRALLSVQPHLSATGFSNYYEELAGQRRQVGAVGSAVVSLVPARAETIFEARRDTDPTFQALLGKWLVPVPRGRQTQYCLLSAGRELMPLNSLTARLVQEDWCQASSPIGASQAALLASAADSGQSVAIPVDLPWMRTVFLETAVYRHGSPVRTVAERRAALTGWVISLVQPPGGDSGRGGHQPGRFGAALPRQPDTGAGARGAGREKQHPRPAAPEHAPHDRRQLVCDRPGSPARGGPERQPAGQRSCLP